MSKLKFAIGILESQLDQADAAIEQFIRQNPEEEIEKLVDRYTKMCKSSDASDVLCGHLCMASLMKGMILKWRKDNENR